MNRVFIFLVLSGCLAALGLDLFGPPLHIDAGAVLDQKSGTRVVSVLATAGATLKFSDAALGLAGAVVQVQETAVPVAGKRAVSTGSMRIIAARAGVQTQINLDAPAVLIVVESDRGCDAETVAKGLVRLGTIGAGVKKAPRMNKVTSGMLDMASVAAKLALGLIGILALWMGVLRVAEASGLVELLARALRPVLVRLFPEVPPDHPAMGAMVMNIAANLLGLGNAATPLGLEAMKRLQELNPHKRTASNAMVLFLAINTSGLTMLPTKTIALRAENGSADPVAILVPTLIATAASTVVAIFVAKLLARRFPISPDDGSPDDGSPDDVSPDAAAPDAQPTPLEGASTDLVPPSTDAEASA